MLKKISKTALTITLIVTLLINSISSVLAVTFTAGQAKRDAPGPFAEAAGLK